MRMVSTRLERVGKADRLIEHALGRRIVLIFNIKCRDRHFARDIPTLQCVKAGLASDEGNGMRSAHADTVVASHDGASVGIKTARNIQCQNRASQLIDRFDDGSQVTGNHLG